MGVNIIQNGVHFDVDISNKTNWLGTKIVNQANDDFSMNEADGDNPGDDVVPYVNAVEIDWNGAQLNIDNQDITINTTGELLNVVTNLANMAINNLRTAQTLLNQIAPSPEETE